MKTPVVKLFQRYVSVGVLNTILHWLVFFALIELANLDTAYANLLAFFVAATFSFFANAIYTFRAKATQVKYLSFVTFMAVISFSIGWLTDRLDLSPLVALVCFSLMSLVLGFLYSRYIVFKEKN